MSLTENQEIFLSGYVKPVLEHFSRTELMVRAEKQVPRIFVNREEGFNIESVLESLPDEERGVLSQKFDKGCSFYSPIVNVVYIHNLRKSDIAEEATHFCHNLNAPNDFSNLSRKGDCLWAVIMYEALGFYGSKVIQPWRRPIKIESLDEKDPYQKSLIDGYYNQIEFMSAVVYTTPENDVPDDVMPLFFQNESLMQPYRDLAHIMGYELGQTFFKRKRRDLALRIFNNPLKENLFITYLNILENLNGVDETRV